jgi:hypothetical protein
LRLHNENDADGGAKCQQQPWPKDPPQSGRTDSIPLTRINTNQAAKRILRTEKLRQRKSTPEGLPDVQNARPNRQIITPYEPMFKEKLERRERRGQGRCSEAAGLRKALALICSARTGSRHDEQDQPLSAAEK